MPWVNNPNTSVKIVTLITAFSVLVVLSIPTVGNLVLSATMYTSLGLWLFILLHSGSSNPIVGQIFVSVLDQEAAPGDTWMESENSIEEAADESVPIGIFLLIAISLTISLVYGLIYPLPNQLYGLLFNGFGGLILAIDRPRKLGTITISTEYQTKQVLQGFWGALLLALGFLLQLLAILS